MHEIRRGFGSAIMGSLVRRPGLVRRGVALGLGLASVVLAGCAGGPTSAGPTSATPGQGGPAQGGRVASRDPAHAAGRARPAVAPAVFCAVRPTARLSAQPGPTVPESLHRE